MTEAEYFRANPKDFRDSVCNFLQDGGAYYETLRDGSYRYGTLITMVMEALKDSERIDFVEKMNGFGFVNIKGFEFRLTREVIDKVINNANK